MHSPNLIKEYFMFRKPLHLFCMLLLCLLSVKPALAVPPITTQGNQVLIGGEQGSLAGNSFYWTNFGGDAYYNRNVVSWLKEDWNSTIVRAAMGIQEFNGFLSNRSTNFNAVVSLVEAAIEEDVYVIIDWHSHSAENNTNEAVQFFSEMAERYGDNEHVLFEIYNEPIGDFDDAVNTWNTIRDYAAPVIAAIREHSDNLIIVGTPFFSQRVDIASQNPITGVENLAYTLHFYAGTHGESLRNQARTALSNGIPLFVTEWGSVNADGNGSANESSTREWMAFLEENNISHLNWAVNDLDEGASVLLPTGQGQGNNGQGANTQGNWPLSLLTPSGRLSRDINRNWPAIGNANANPITPTNTVTPTVDDENENSNLTFVPITTLIEAENYSSQSGIQVEPTTDIGGGQNIGFIENNDYAEYNVNVETAGTYTLEMRLASRNDGGDITMQINGNDRANLSVGTTGGWQNWVTVDTQVNLDAGEQTLRFLFTDPVSTSGLLNVNWIDFTLQEDQPEVTIQPEVTQPIITEPIVVSQPEPIVTQPTPTPTQPSDDNFASTCEFVIVNEWASGFVGEVRVRNNGTQTIDIDWSVNFQLINSEVVNSWNSDYQGDTASPLSWNRVISANGTTVFGFQASKNQISSPAIAPRVNGILCN